MSSETSIAAPESSQDANRSLECPPLCLVVDDSRTIRLMTSQMLRDLRLIAVEAGSGVEAVETCHKVVPDVVLLDWNMPEMDGITCLRELRAMELDPRPVIIMCTTESAMPKILEALEAGADEYIMKPFDREVLLDKLLQFDLLGGR